MPRTPLPVRLLVSDLDGTILGPDGAVTPRVREALGAVRACGVTVVVATGRMYRSTSRLARELGLTAPLICYQGAYVRELPDADGTPGALLRHVTLPAPVAREVIRWTRERGLDPHVNIDDRLIMAVGDEGADDYERSAGVDAEFVADLVGLVERPVTKVLAVGPPGVPERLLEEARRAFAGRAEVTVSHPEYLEFMAPGVHKGAAVRWLARRLGIPLAATMAIGDQYNDLEMIMAAGWGVAMGGAPEPVRAAARFSTASYAEDGAALAVEALILGRGTLERALAT